MGIPADFVLKTGWYKNLKTGAVNHYCNCGKQPAHLTLRHIAANREDYEPYTGKMPPPQPPVTA